MAIGRQNLFLYTSTHFRTKQRKYSICLKRQIVFTTDLRCFVQKCELVDRNKFCRPIAIVRLMEHPTLEVNCSALDYDFGFIFWIHIIYILFLIIFVSFWKKQ